MRLEPTTSSVTVKCLDQYTTRITWSLVNMADFLNFITIIASPAYYPPLLIKISTVRRSLFFDKSVKLVFCFFISYLEIVGTNFRLETWYFFILFQ